MIYSLLLIEDTINIGEPIKLYLESCQYHVDRSTSISQAKEYIESKTYNCIIIDRMLPDGDGIELCKSIKTLYPHIPCILETAKFQIEDKIEGFDAGADDYITKPYDLRELEIRVHNLIERFNKAIERNYYSITLGDIHINIDTMEIVHNNTIIHCTAHEWIVIKMICEDPNKVIPRIELCEYIRGDEAQRASDNKLDVLISGIRKKLGRKTIKTIKGVGYMLGERNNI